MSINYKHIRKLSALVLGSNLDRLTKSFTKNEIADEDDLRHVFEHNYYHFGHYDDSVSLRRELLNMFLHQLYPEVDYRAVVQYTLLHEEAIKEAYLKQLREFQSSFREGTKTLERAYEILKSLNSWQIFNAQVRRLINDAIEEHGIIFSLKDEVYPHHYIPLVTTHPNKILTKEAYLRDIITINMYRSFADSSNAVVESDENSFIDYRIDFSEPSAAQVKVYDIKTKSTIFLKINSYHIIQILGNITKDIDIQAPQPEKYANRQNLTADQLALLRQFDLHGVSEISSDKLRKLPFALNNPVLKKILDENPVLTPEAVLKYKPEDLLGINEQTAIYSNIRSVMQTGFREFNMGIQVLFPSEQNYSFVVGIPKEQTSYIFGRDSLEELEYYTNTTNHPTLRKGLTLTIGWVRFTKLSNNNIWIDEIQTDLTKKVDRSVLEALGGMNGLTKFVLETFISTMRGKGFQKFYIPDLKTKTDVYHAKPPESIYTELPKKLRFKKVGIPETSLIETEKVSIADKLEKIKNASVWVLASKEQ